MSINAILFLDWHLGFGQVNMSLSYSQNLYPDATDVIELLLCSAVWVSSVNPLEFYSIQLGFCSTFGSLGRSHSPGNAPVSFCQNLHYLNHFCNDNQMVLILAVQYDVSSPQVHYAKFCQPESVQIYNKPPKCLHFPNTPCMICLKCI